MNDKIQIIEQISAILKDCKYAVLATDGEGQPHASLIGVTWLQGYRQLIFVTYRGTLKHSNISKNGKVAILVESGSNSISKFQERSVITAYGYAEEIGLDENVEILKQHLDRHPDLLFLSQSQDCALIKVNIKSYQIVHGVEDVKWVSLDDLDNQTPQ